MMCFVVTVVTFKANVTATTTTKLWIRVLPHIVAGACYKDLDLNCCTAQYRRPLTIGVDGAMSAV